MDRIDKWLYGLLGAGFGVAGSLAVVALDYWGVWNRLWVWSGLWRWIG